jgi:uncharacterized membrane protein YgdD (TMEM256/DUF423 family)
MHKSFLKIATLLGALAVILGAFGAHSLKQVVSENAVNTFETGVRYQFYHAFALLATGFIYKDFANKWIRNAGRFFITGIILFSGSLYVLTFFVALVKPAASWIGIITPFGGLAFILGWVFLFIGIKKERKSF